MALIKLRHEVELRALVGAGDVAGAFEIDDRSASRAEQGALMRGRQEARAPIKIAAFYTLIVAEHDVAREVVVFGAEPIRDPRTRSGKAGAGDAGIDLIQRRDVVVRLAVKRFHECEVVHMPRDIWVVLANRSTGLAVLPECKRRFHERPGIAVEDVDRDALAVAFGEFGLWVKHVHRAWCALHEEPDYGLRLRRKMRDARSHWIQ